MKKIYQMFKNSSLAAQLVLIGLLMFILPMLGLCFYIHWVLGLCITGLVLVASGAIMLELD